MRKAIRRMLSFAPDIEVIDTAADGREAVEKTAQLRPDIVTMDVKMAGMDGLAALERIWARSTLTEEEAMALALEAQREVREERRRREQAAS